MKKAIIYVFVCAVLTGVLINLSSCEKDKGTPPNIAFITTAGYIGADTTVAGGSSITIGVSCTLAESGDVLKTLNLSHSTDNTNYVTVSTTNIPTASQDAYAQTDNVTTSATGVTDYYKYTVTNRDGITNSVTVKVINN